MPLDFKQSRRAARRRAPRSFRRPAPGRRPPPEDPRTPAQFAAREFVRAVKGAIRMELKKNGRILFMTDQMMTELIPVVAKAAGLRSPLYRIKDNVCPAVLYEYGPGSWMSGMSKNDGSGEDIAAFKAHSLRTEIANAIRRFLQLQNVRSDS